MAKKPIHIGSGLKKVLKVGGIAAAVVGTGFLGFEGGSMITKAAKAFHAVKAAKAEANGTGISDEYQDQSMNVGIGGSAKTEDFDDANSPDAQYTALHTGASMQKIEAMAKKYWWVGAIIAGIFFLPRLMGGSHGGYHRKKKSK